MINILSIMLAYVLLILVNAANAQRSLIKDTHFLDIENFDFTTVPHDLLKGFPNVTQLTLSRNKLKYIEKNDFRLLTKLKRLDLSSNDIYGVHQDAFLNMKDLEIIDLRNNNLKYIPIIKAPNLKIIYFGNNDISHLVFDSLIAYKSVEKMDFQNNQIIELKSKAFDGKKNLKFLDLSGNPLEKIHPLSLNGLNHLHTLLLNKTKIESIPQNGVENIQILDISDNPHLLHIPDEKFFKAIRNIKVTYSMHCCVFQNPSNHIGHDHGGEEITCTPSPNAFNPCHDMLGPLRAITWILCIFVIWGNLFLLIVMYKSDQKTVHRLLMYNLGIANLLMGLYLFLLCCVDAYSYNKYYQVAQVWQYSGGCKTIGFFAMFSLSLSLCSVVLLAVERFILIKYSLVSDNEKMRRGAKICIAASWFYSFILAILPAVDLASSYTQTALCLPLDITKAQSVGYITWILMSYLFALTAIIYIHYGIFNILKATSNNDGQGINQKTTKRLALVIFSNFMLWLPISITGFCLVFGNHSFDKTVGKILLILTLPLSAAIIPVIYALLTKRFQEDIQKIFCNQNNIMNEDEEEYRGRASSYFKHIFHGKQRSETKTSVLMHCHEGDPQQSNCTIVNETNKKPHIPATVDSSHKKHIQQLSGSPNIYRDERSSSTRGLLEDYRKTNKSEDSPTMV